MRAWRFAAALLLVAAVMAVYHWALAVNAVTAALTLLLAILFISTLWGLAEATAASIAAVLGFNYFFLEPIGTFRIQDSQNIVAFVAFLITAVTTSQLSAYARRRTAEAEARRLEMERLYALVQTMMLRDSARNTASEFVQDVMQAFGCSAAAFYYRRSGEVFRSGPLGASRSRAGSDVVSDDASDDVSDGALRAAAEASDISVDREHGIAIAPVRLGLRSLGSMALMGAPHSALPSEQTLRAIGNLAAIAIERARAFDEASRSESARQSEALKTALLDSLAHDIKTPLTSIKAAVTSLLGGAEPNQRELLTIIDEEADRLNRLAAEVVAMARIEAGKLHLEKRPVAASEIVSNALNTLPADARPVTVNVAAELPLVDADPEFAAQAVKQLVENALKYSPAGSPVVVSAERRDARIVIGVADRGPGIEENERARIFDKFFRGRRHRFDTKGTGMGLAIAKGIVEAHGGRIWVESEPGQGSVFYFALPAIGGREN
ncbi:MAG: ATP-binding protein [Bryobacteraceae bacterium]|jgi:two-component system sensor histidine kinase KdpD